MKEHKCVTIGICCTCEADLIYSINTVYAQDYENIELIIFISGVSDILYAEVIDCIKGYNNRPVRVKIAFQPISTSKEEGIGYIISHMKGDYLIFLFDSACFYECNSLNKIMDPCQKGCYAVMGKSIFYDINTKKCTCIKKKQFRNILEECYVYETNALKEYYLNYKSKDKNQHFLKRYTKSLNKRNKIQNIESFILRKNEEEISSIIPKCKFFSLNKENSLISNLNYSAIASVKNFIDKIQKSTYESKKEIKCEIKRNIQVIFNRQQGSEWTLGNSDCAYIALLQKILKELNGNALKRQKWLTGLKDKLEVGQNKKIKLVFLTMEYAVWPSFMPVYKQALLDSRYECKIVCVPFSSDYKIESYKEELEKYERNGYPVIHYESYDLAQDSPDIAFIIKPYNSVPSKYYITQVQRIVPRSIYIPYAMETSGSNDSIFYQCIGAVQLLSWKVMAWGPAYYEKMKKYTLNKGDNYLPIGHPRADIKADNDYALEKKIKAKSKGKKIIMWNTHFTLEENSGWGSYMEWGKYILEYFRNNDDLILLWRPHPFFYMAYAQKMEMDVNKVIEWFEKLDLQKNIVIDSTESYLTSFNLSDALISDATSFVPEYLCQRKPILYTPKKHGTPLLDEELEKDLCRVTTEKDIATFLNSIKDNKPLKVLDEKKYLYIPEKGSISEALLEYIHNHLINDDLNNKWMQESRNIIHENSFY